MLRKFPAFRSVRLHVLDQRDVVPLEHYSTQGTSVLLLGVVFLSFVQDQVHVLVESDWKWEKPEDYSMDLFIYYESLFEVMQKVPQAGTYRCVLLSADECSHKAIPGRGTDFEGIGKSS